jgi:hypothetical protein
MDDANDSQTQPPRFPTLEDLLFLCRQLNESKARYIVIGGWAIIEHGYGRTTGDIDLLVESSPENFEKIMSAMLKLPDGAIREVAPDDLDKYVVVRVGDEFLIDLMKTACGIEYAEASKDISFIRKQDVLIPFANPKLLLRLKQTYREKDVEDKLFLMDLIRRQEKEAG